MSSWIERCCNMKESHVRVRFTAGELTLEFEGSEILYRESFDSLLERLTTQADRHDEALSSSSASSSSVPTPREDLSIINVCEILEPKSGPDVTKAAIVKLSLIDGMQSVPRRDILREIDNAHGYQQPSHKSNLGTNLNRLVDRKEIIKESKDRYALSASEKSRYSKLLNIS